MPLVFPVQEVRSCQICLKVTELEFQALTEEARKRYPMTVTQIVYERFIRGGAATARSRSREVCRIVGKRKEGGK